jgi:hypothetical protein
MLSILSMHPKVESRLTQRSLAPCNHPPEARQKVTRLDCGQTRPGLLEARGHGPLLLQWCCIAQVGQKMRGVPRVNALRLSSPESSSEW